MATLTEKIDSREWTEADKSSATFHYILDGTSDDLTARSLLLGSTPTWYNGLRRDECTLEPIFVDTVSGTGKWECRVRYVSPEYTPPEVGESSFAFDTGGGTQHITQSLGTVGSYAASGTAPNFGGAVGVTHDNVEGVDITVPVYNFSETHYLADATVTLSYRGTLFNLTGKVNNGSFKGLAAGECLFLGASGSKRGEDDWEITYRFAASPNRSGISVGPITVASKKGWEYLWVRYADEEDAGSNTLVKKPIAAYVERVYEEGNFAALGIGT
jgi:hypothetical protein